MLLDLFRTSSGIVVGSRESLWSKAGVWGGEYLNGYVSFLVSWFPDASLDECHCVTCTVDKCIDLPVVYYKIWPCQFLKNKLSFLARTHLMTIRNNSWWTQKHRPVLRFMQARAERRSRLSARNYIMKSKHTTGLKSVPKRSPRLVKIDSSYTAQQPYRTKRFQKWIQTLLA